MSRVSPKDPYWRWFSDGFANAVTYEILRKHVSQEQAEQFAAGYDTSKYADLEKELNLRYWMALQWCIETPVKHENRLTYARYAYATREAQRLIGEYGIGCVKRIMDKACVGKRNSSQELYAAIKEVTGLDMDGRLLRYQTFERRKEGVVKYTGQFNAASDKKDYETMLVNALRVLELYESQYSPRSLQARKNVSWILFKLGYEKYGDKAMSDCIERFKNSQIPSAVEAAMECFMIYSLECKNPRKAISIAEEMLERRPEHVLSLTVKMLVLDGASKQTEAREIAKKLCSIVKSKNSPSYKAAVKILANENGNRTE